MGILGGFLPRDGVVWVWPLTTRAEWLAHVMHISTQQAARLSEQGYARVWKRNATDRWRIDYGRWSGARGLAAGELYLRPLSAAQMTVRRQLAGWDRLRLPLTELVWRERGCRRGQMLPRRTRVPRAELDTMISA